MLLDRFVYASSERKHSFCFDSFFSKDSFVDSNLIRRSSVRARSFNRQKVIDRDGLCHRADPIFERSDVWWWSWGLERSWWLSGTYGQKATLIVHLRVAQAVVTKDCDERHKHENNPVIKKPFNIRSFDYNTQAQFLHNLDDTNSLLLDIVRMFIGAVARPPYVIPPTQYNPAPTRIVQLV